MTNANKFNLLLDVVKLMHSLADGLEAVAYAFADSQENLRRSQGSVEACRNWTTHKTDSSSKKHLHWQMSVPCLR